MNNITLTGYLNNVKEIGEKTKVANFSYSIKTKEKEFKNVFIEVYFSKNLDIDNKQKYIIKGFFVGDVWNDKETGKEKNILKIRINSLEPLKEKKDYRNNFEITASVSNIKQISDAITVFRLSYPIKLKDQTIKYIYVDALISNNEDIENRTKYNFKGFFTGKVWIDKKTGKERKKVQLFCTEVKPL